MLMAFHVFVVIVVVLVVDVIIVICLKLTFDTNFEHYAVFFACNSMRLNLKIEEKN